jgi:hypothetical protein
MHHHQHHRSLIRTCHPKLLDLNKSLNIRPKGYALTSWPKLIVTVWSASPYAYNTGKIKAKWVYIVVERIIWRYITLGIRSCFMSNLALLPILGYPYSGRYSSHPHWDLGIKKTDIKIWITIVLKLTDQKLNAAHQPCWACNTIIHKYGYKVVIIRA